LVEKAIEMNKDEMVKASILEAAERVFQKWGLNKTTMEDIAHEAGKGKSTLYYYYESKEAIFDATVTKLLNNLFSKAKEATLEVTSAKDKIKRYIIVFMMEMKNYAILYSIVRREIKGNQTIIDKQKKTFQNQEEIFIKEILEIGIQSKEFSFIGENELNTAVKAIVGIIHALELYFAIENDDIKQIDMAAKLIANGI
jgi:AcrR family transcriptional regulator